MNETAQPRFAEELAAFEAKKPELLKLCEGKFAVFKGAQFLGVFDTPMAAYSAAIAKWGNVPFLIKQVLKIERVESIPALSLGVINARI